MYSILAINLYLLQMFVLYISSRSRIMFDFIASNIISVDLIVQKMKCTSFFQFYTLFYRFFFQINFNLISPV